MKLNEIAKLMRIARQYGVLEFKTSEVEFKLSPSQSLSHNELVSEVVQENAKLFNQLAQPKFIVDSKPSTLNEFTPNNVEIPDEDLLFMSSDPEWGMKDKKSA